MSQISSTGGLAIDLRPWAQEQQPLSAALTSAGFFPILSTDTALLDTGLANLDLLAVADNVDSASRTSNQLSTATDALGVVGGLLGNIQAVLAAAGDPSQPFDPAAEQSRIDDAVSTLNAIASSSQFGGQNLLDGSFSLGGLSLPSFLSQKLGASQAGNQDSGQSQALDSMATGGANALSSGNLAAAGQIVSTALSQVSQSQSDISSYQNSINPDPLKLLLGALPLGDLSSDAALLAATQALSHPWLSAVPRSDALALLLP